MRWSWCGGLGIGVKSIVNFVGIGLHGMLFIVLCCVWLSRCGVALFLLLCLESHANKGVIEVAICGFTVRCHMTSSEWGSVLPLAEGCIILWCF